MNRCRLALAVMTTVLVVGPQARADETAEKIRDVMGRISPSLVTVSYYVERNDGSKADMRVPGCVVGAKNLVMMTSLAIRDEVPIGQYHDFEVIVSQGAALKEYKAEYLGKDDTAQVAFLRVTDASAAELPALAFPEGKPIELGEPLLSFGSLGEPDAYKVVTYSVRIAARIEKPYVAYLVDGNLGTPGTPVATLDGVVVGIVGTHALDRGKTAGPLQFQRVQVVWPTERFAALLQAPPEGGKQVKRAWLGVSDLNPLTKEMATYYGLADRGGVIIGRVIDDSPAAKAGLKATDIILAMDGKNITGPEGQYVRSFQNSLKEMKIGQEISLEIFRDLKTQTIKVTLSEPPKEATEAKRHKNKQFGLTVREMVVMDRVERELPAGETGIVVEFVEQSGWAEDGGLEAGDIVKKVQDRETPDLDAFSKVFEEEVAKKPKELVLFVLRGKKETQLIRIEPRWDTEGGKKPEDAGKAKADGDGQKAAAPKP